MFKLASVRISPCKLHEVHILLSITTGPTETPAFMKAPAQSEHEPPTCGLLLQLANVWSESASEIVVLI